MVIKDYSDINVKLLRSTDNPMEVVGKAAAITMKRDFETGVGDGNMCLRLYRMNHTSLFEHVSYTFLITGASRSFLAQITRHRISSFTSGSQHYQDYGSYGLAIDTSVLRLAPRLPEVASICVAAYNEMLAAGVPKWEARQILPGGMENNLMWTVNARSLANFLNLRLCSRNVTEMRVVAHKVLRIAEAHFPELFCHVGPDCYLRGECSQGGMSCRKLWERP